MIILFNFFNKRNNNIINIRKDGTKAFLRLETFQPAHSDILSDITFYVTDVTEEIRMEEELKLKDSAIEASINAIALLDLSYSVIYANKSFVKIFGYKNKNDAAGRRATEFIVFDESFRSATSALFESGSFSGEYKGIKPDGTITP